MSDEPIGYVFNRNWGLADSKKELRFDSRMCYHFLDSVTIVSF